MRANTGFLSRLATALQPYPTAARYLIGVSGGRDSVALLHGLLALGYRSLVVSHLDHGLRGTDAEVDAAFVRDLALNAGLTVEIGSADTAGHARASKLSVETAARELRYRFFATVSRRQRCRTLLLAHQADDQVETFLFNLLRGAGPGGLSGMRSESTRRIVGVELKIVRPLLAVWREEIDAYLTDGKISWREDRTNADPAHGTRNRLRAEALPLLERVMNRPVKPALWRTVDLLGAEESARRESVEQPSTAPEILSVKELCVLPLAQRRRTVRNWLLGQGITGVGYREVAAVLSLLEGNGKGPAKVNLPDNRHARRRAGTLFLE